MYSCILISVLNVFNCEVSYGIDDINRRWLRNASAYYVFT